MSSVDYMTSEPEETAVVNGDEAEGLKPFIVLRRSGGKADEVVRRAADILDFELPRGLMPS